MFSHPETLLTASHMPSHPGSLTRLEELSRLLFPAVKPTALPQSLHLQCVVDAEQECPSNDACCSELLSAPLSTDAPYSCSQQQVSSNIPHPGPYPLTSTRPSKTGTRTEKQKRHKRTKKEGYNSTVSKLRKRYKTSFVAKPHPTPLDSDSFTPFYTVRIRRLTRIPRLVSPIHRQNVQPVSYVMT